MSHEQAHRASTFAHNRVTGLSISEVSVINTRVCEVERSDAGPLLLREQGRGFSILEGFTDNLRSDGNDQGGKREPYCSVRPSFGALVRPSRHIPSVASLRPACP